MEINKIFTKNIVKIKIWVIYKGTLLSKIGYCKSFNMCKELLPLTQILNSFRNNIDSVKHKLTNLL